MGIATPEFVIPSGRLPDGRITFEAHRDTDGLVEALTNYDPALSLVRNVRAHRWEVWRMCEDNRPRCIAKIAQDPVPAKNQLLAQLAAYDTRRGFDPVADIQRAEDLEERRRDRDFDDEASDLGDKLHHALAHDLHAHAPAVRPIFLGNSR